MVEKISKASANIAVAENIDSSSDSSSLLKAINKKKKQKQADENELAAGMASLGMQARLNNLAALGCGGLKTEKQSVKQSGSTFSWSSGDSLASGKDDSVRRKVALAAAALTQTQTVSAEKDSSHKATSTPVSAALTQTQTVSAEKDSSQKATSTSVSATLTHAANSVQLSQNQVAALVALSSSATETEPQELLQHLKDDAGEVRPTLSAEKQSTVVLPQQDKTTPQNKNESATLMQLKTQASAEVTSAKQGSESQTLEVDYPFQRWSGDHSVKVSVPIDVRRDGSVTLLPSDARAAEALLRNMGDLTSLSPELLQPQQERDEQQQHQQQQQQDEEQE